MVDRSSPFFVPSDLGGLSARYRNRFLPSTGQTGNVLSVTWDFRPIIRLAARIAGEAANADPPIRAAHREMALWTQHYQAQSLEDSVRSRGREQKATQALLNAVLDERSSDVNLSGFTSGYLNRIQEVELYWRRIEEGSSTQVGQTFYGMFLSKAGKWSWPSRENQVDLRLIKFGAVGPLTQGGTLKSYLQRALDGEENTGGRTPVVTIRKPIPAYHFLADGYRQFLASEGAFPAVIGFYTEAFNEAGMDFLTRWARRYGAAKPAPRSITKGYGAPG